MKQIILWTILIMFGSLNMVQPASFAGDQARVSPITVPDNSKDASSFTLHWMGHWLHEDLRETLVLEMAEIFEFEHPDSRLDLRFPQDIMGSRSKPLAARYIAEMIRSGKIEFDVIWLDDHIYRLVSEELSDPEWGRKHLVDFTDVPEFRESQKSFIITDPVYRNQTGGILVGPYIEGYLYAIWYNQDVARVMGLTIREREMTFDDLLGYVKAVHTYNLTADTPVAAFYEARDWTTLEILFQVLVKSEIENFQTAISETCTPDKLVALKKTLSAFEELGKYRPLIESHDKNTWYDTRDIVLNDQALFYVNGTWMYSHWRGLAPELFRKMVPAELPVFNYVKHGLGGYIPTWAVMKASPNRDSAIHFLIEWSRPKVAEKWVRYTKNPTGLHGNLDRPTFGSDIYEKFQADMTREFGSQLHYTADIGYLLGEANSNRLALFNSQLRQLLTGETTAGEAYDVITRNLK